MDLKGFWYFGRHLGFCHRNLGYPLAHFKEFELFSVFFYSFIYFFCKIVQKLWPGMTLSINESIANNMNTFMCYIQSIIVAQLAAITQVVFLNVYIMYSNHYWVTLTDFPRVAPYSWIQSYRQYLSDLSNTTGDKNNKNSITFRLHNTKRTMDLKFLLVVCFVFGCIISESAVSYACDMSDPNCKYMNDFPCSLLFIYLFFLLPG